MPLRRGGPNDPVCPSSYEFTHKFFFSFSSSVLCGSLSVLQTPLPHPLTFSSNFLFELATRASAVRRRILSLHPHTHSCGTRSKLVLVYHAYIFSIFFWSPLFLSCSILPCSDSEEAFSRCNTARIELSRIKVVFNQSMKGCRINTAKPRHPNKGRSYESAKNPLPSST